MQDTPKDLDKKRTDEKLLVSEMIALYCRRQHKTPKGTLCPECRQLHDYALMRIDKCPFMETKTLPSSGCRRPVMMFIKVDFPSPFAPIKPMCSPFKRRKETSWKMALSPKP